MARILALILLLSCNQVFSKDLGTFGRCYEIAEDDFKKHLKMEEKPLLITVQAPKAVEGLQKAKKYSVRYFDPTIQAKQEIKDREGNIIVRKGERFNPLDKVSLTEKLLFFDATDEKQIAWARELSQPTKWILVRGNPMDLEKVEERPIFFDQGGFLVKHFGIRCIPTQISQQGKKLKIEEVLL